MQQWGVTPDSARATVLGESGLGEAWESEPTEELAEKALLTTNALRTNDLRRLEGTDVDVFFSTTESLNSTNRIFQGALL